MGINVVIFFENNVFSKDNTKHSIIYLTNNIFLARCHILLNKFTRDWSESDRRTALCVISVK